MKKYHKIKNYNNLDFNESTWWVITEKIHGANFSLQYENGEWFVATRNNKYFINSDFEFYNWRLTGILEYYKEIKFNLDGDIEQLAVYGEIYGGMYWGISEGKRVQKGINYNPKNKWRIFDVIFNNRFLDYDEFEEFATRFSIPTVPLIEIFWGTKDEVIELVKKNFLGKNTLVPQLDRLIVQEGENIAEGYVIKPKKNIFDKKGERIIFKIKNPKFEEVVKVKERKVTKEIPEHYIPYINKAKELINENRLNSVISKVGENNVGDIFKEFVQDVIEEINLEILNKKDKKKITKIINKEASNFVREKLYERGLL